MFGRLIAIRTRPGPPLTGSETPPASHVLRTLEGIFSRILGPAPVDEDQEPRFPVFMDLRAAQGATHAPALNRHGLESSIRGMSLSPYFGTNCIG